MLGLEPQLLGCKHETIEYIGMQERVDLPPIKLYNCKQCGSTVTKEKIGEKIK